MADFEFHSLLSFLFVQVKRGVEEN